MPARTLVPVEEYLHTSYDPDCDYVDGEVVERNVGERDHSELQSEIVTYFRSRRQKLKVHAFVRAAGTGCTHAISDSRHLHHGRTKTHGTDFHSAAAGYDRDSFERGSRGLHAGKDRR